jgi:GT2 family glycosyltransferase
MNIDFNQLGFVVIGRNEGPRLGRCLASLGERRHLVYVDSSSRDDSVAIARRAGADVVELTGDEAFTAARARNAGATWMHENRPEVQFVQFLDGDCEVAAGWIDAGLAALTAHAQLAVVAGRVRERHPEASIYNRLCDLEWSVLSRKDGVCGGNSLVRLAAFRQVDGFEQNIMSGEEADLCRRLRARGWSVGVLPVEMVQHDADIKRFAGWWRRSVREGHCIAEEAWRDVGQDNAKCIRALISLVLWSAMLPVLALGAAWHTYGISLVVVAGVYALQGYRIARHGQRSGWSPADSRLYAAFTLLGKFAGLVGAVKFYGRALLSRPRSIIDHKAPTPCPEAP